MLLLLVVVVVERIEMITMTPSYASMRRIQLSTVEHKMRLPHKLNLSVRICEQSQFQDANAPPSCLLISYNAIFVKSVPPTVSVYEIAYTSPRLSNAATGLHFRSDKSRIASSERTSEFKSQNRMVQSAEVLKNLSDALFKSKQRIISV